MHVQGRLCASGELLAERLRPCQRLCPVLWGVTSSTSALRAAAALVAGLAQHVPAAQHLCTTAHSALTPEQAVLVR